MIIGTLPAPPRLVRRVIIDASAYVDGELTVEWDYPSETGGVDLTSYEVWVDDGLGSWAGSVAPLANPGPEDLSLAINGLTTGTTYGIKMNAVTPIGRSIDADVVYIVCAAKAPAPAAPTAEASASDAITLAWNEPVSATQATVVGYNLYYNDLSVGDWMLAYTGVGYPTRQVYVVGNLTQGQTYRFKVSAVNAAGESENSTETVVIASDYPDAPGQPRRESSTDSSVSISWTPPEENGGESVFQYEVYYKEADQAEAAWALITTITDINALAYTHTGLSTDVDVQYKVRAESGKGYGAFSIRNTFVLAGYPSVTNPPARVSSTRTSVTTEWLISDDGGTPITGYRLY